MQQTMGENIWQNVFHEIFKKSLTFRGKDLIAEEMNKQFETNGIYPVIKAGEVVFTSGRVEIGDPFCYMNSKYSCTLDRVVKPGSYPLYLSIMDHAVFGHKFLTAKLEISKKAPVRYELAMPEGHSIEDKDKPGVFAVFGVDTGLACICDKETSIAYDLFLKDWHQKNPGKNHYDDYFENQMKDYAIKYPEYQRPDGDYFSWELPGTKKHVLMFTSGLGDGAYSAYWGLDEKGEIACLVIPFIHPEAYNVPMPKEPEKKQFYLKAEEITRLIDSELFCLATDRIMVEGAKVGYMKRDTPSKNHEQESGWIFFEGTEDEEYMSDSSHIGIYKLNTLANYDRDIIPYLDLPAETALYREKDGKFYIDEL